jgi:hypothetical protein
MIPFRTNLGAAGYVEDKTQGDTSVLIVQGIRGKLRVLRVTYHDTGDRILGAQPIEVQKGGPWKPKPWKPWTSRFRYSGD